jgi:hypothetical protein
MKALPATPELLRVAQRVIWFEAPEKALADPVRFLAHVMVFGTVEDLRALRGIVGKDEYREVLEHAPPGLFDLRSWAYWNLVCERRPAPPPPVRAGLQRCGRRREGKMMAIADEHATEPAGDRFLDNVLLRVDAETYARFLARLDAPPQPNERLRKLLQTKAPWD